MAWQDILKNFKDQFASTGIEQFGNIKNPEVAAQLSQERGNIYAKGMDTTTNYISKQAAEAKAAAEKVANAKATGTGYQKVYNAVGGYSFFDNNGKPISAFEFANAKQLPISNVLQGSYDAGDIQFLQDLNNMAVDMTPDPTTGKALYDAKEGLKKITEAYPNIFLGKGAPTGKFAEDRLATRKALIPATTESTDRTDPKKLGFGERVVNMFTRGDKQDALDQSRIDEVNQNITNEVINTLKPANTYAEAQALKAKLYEKYQMSPAIDYTNEKWAGEKEAYIANIADNLIAQVFAQAKPTTSVLPF